jgi:carbonic anhydrase
MHHPAPWDQPCERLDQPGQGLNREQAFRRILDGHWRYLQNERQQIHVTHEDRQRHAEGQFPFAAILGCADSRVSPEVIFDQGQGDLFVVRVAGNVLGDFEQASLEYAVQNLGVRLVLVMGHEQCGAVKAAIGGTVIPGVLGQLINEIRPAVEQAQGQDGDLLNNAIRSNVCHTVDMLLERSAAIRDLVATGEVRVIGLVYDLASGDLQFQRTVG